MLCCKGTSLRYSPGQGYPLQSVVALYVGEGSEREQNHLLGSHPTFSHFCHFPQANWAPLVLILGGWVCVCSRTWWVSPKNSPMRLEFLPLLQPPQIFSFRGFEAVFPHTGTLGCMVCLSTQLFLPVYQHTNVGLPAVTADAWLGPLAAALLWVLYAPADCLSPSYQSV